MIRRNWKIVELIAIAAVLVMACGTTHAQVKPFKIVGAGLGTEGIPLPGAPSRPHWAAGTATHLGKYYGDGRVQTDTNNLAFHGDGSITGEFGSAVPFVFAGADGDELACHYGRTAFGAAEPGTFLLAPLGGGVYMAFWIAEFVPVAEECTGKFAGVSGSWIMYARSEPFVLGASDPVAYSWQGQGSLTFAKPQGKK